MGKHETETLKGNFVNIRQKIQKDRDYIDVLMRKRVGNTGYYYIISLDGIITAHPQTFLKGADYSKFSFIQEILNNRNGCISYIIAEKEFTVIHEPLNAEEILCLAIESDELTDRGTMCRRSSFRVN